MLIFISDCGENRQDTGCSRFCIPSRMNPPVGEQAGESFDIPLLKVTIHRQKSNLKFCLHILVCSMCIHIVIGVKSVIPEVKYLPWNRCFLTGLKLSCQGQVPIVNPSILSIRFLFISHQSGQNSWDEAISNLTMKYPMTWSWARSKSRSHIIPSIQLMFCSFVPHQSGQPFLRYGQNSVWPWKNTSEFFKENWPK